jgi:prepilin-type N-terminal cleavage/methylation domain-containing protein
MRKRTHTGTTLVELLIVLAIIGLLSTVAVNVYLGRVELARVAATKSLIDRLATALATYEVDLGQYPPSGSGTQLAPNQPDNLSYFTSTFSDVGSGYVFVALTRSLNGNSQAPLTVNWRGPYITFHEREIGNPQGAPVTTEDLPEYQILDAWGNPLIFIRGDDYEDFLATERPAGSALTTLAYPETYFGTGHFQIISKGPNGATLAPPFRGLEPDDVTNFGY